QAAAAPAAALSGYRLPYAGGETMRLTQSVGHDRYTPSGNAHFSFDFAKPGYPSGMFNVHAARGGTVVRVRWTQANGSEAEPGNYIVLEDTSTSPTTYQLYLHFAQDSIPEALRTVGTYVPRGQFLGIADDTGVSSGNHLHFMVHTSATSYWGRAVDIVFEEVTINGGRPRITSDKSYCKSSDVCDTFQTDYLSNNYMIDDLKAPVGSLTRPGTGSTVGSATLALEGWALDEGSGLAEVQIIARQNGDWQPVGPAFTSNTFSHSLDVCSLGFSDGPFSLALRIRDRVNNRAAGLPGLTQLVKDYDCQAAQTVCSPAANQAALFAEKDFKGACVVLGPGTYPDATSLGAVGDNAAVSIQVGSAAQVSLFSEPILQGRGETFLASDANLADNRVARKQASSLVVQARGAAPTAPQPVWPANNASVPVDGSLSLSWRDTGGATQFQARIQKSGSTVQELPWSVQTFWHVSGLGQGTYTWQVKARSGQLESGWTTARTLVIGAAGLPAETAQVAPYRYDVESGASFAQSSGWLLTTTANHTTGGGKSYRYAPGSGVYSTGSANAGWLTSPPVQLPAGAPSYLRFWYQYETESAEATWDQRWVQISVDGGPFTNLLQLNDDAPNYWLQSPAVSLAAFAGRTVRVRFYIVTLDAVLNEFKGWYIDDVSISSEAPEACSDTNNSPAQAQPLAYGAAAEGAICPGGDVEYYAFQGVSGDQVGAWVEAAVNGSPLDGLLVLLDSDGRSLLVSNDDQVQYTRPDPWLTYRLPRSGTYYLKLRAWNHPSSGGPGYTYRLRLARDAARPIATITNPARSQLSGNPLTLQVQAADSDSGISHVGFMLHSGDWNTGKWIDLGDDWDGSDGWSAPVVGPNRTGLAGGAIYVKIYDWAGSWTWLTAWDLRNPGIYLPIVFKGR
ncbi:MAG: peptidoglycan DD-metalloendopeptidase family protein, partial [Chloroflexota bacterium]